MEFRWLGNSCIEIKGEKHILIDPLFLHPPEPKIEYILITHEHKDHIGEEALSFCAKFFCPPYTASLYHFPTSPIKVLVGEEINGIKVVEVECMGSGGSVGYIVEEKGVRIFHPGDAFYIKGIEADILFVPTFGDYHAQILESIKNCKAKWAFPIHFDPGKKEKMEVAQTLCEKINEMGINSRILKIGEWLNVKDLLKSHE